MMIMCQYELATYPIPSPFIHPTSYGSPYASPCRLCVAALQLQLRRSLFAIITTGMMHSTLRFQIPFGSRLLVQFILIVLELLMVILLFGLRLLSFREALCGGGGD